MDSSTESIATTSLAIEHHGKRILIEAVAGDHIAAMIDASKKFYEWQYLGTLAEYLKPGDLVLDVGANIGNHSLYFAAVCEAKVISFEPLPLAADILQRNVDSNSLQDHIEVRRVALGEKPSRATLDKLDLKNVGATTFAVSSNGEYAVSAIDVEEIRQRVALIKVDAEGMDVAVLKGAIDLIARDRPIIACEAATAVEQAELEQFASESGYSFVAQFNATPTYILVPSATPLERAHMERRAAGLITRTNWATRDLYYRLGLVNGELKSIKDGLSTAPAEQDASTAVAGLSERVKQLEVLLGELSNRLEDRDPNAAGA
ncbi:FkbM family methyltransferase [Paenarthrobacter aromaticivorans]|uniref:FkbM family methyltransferase n=1 Tax=Paenarthrobacter aromaticivorans TaxID=2849150 RepID=A0ABS6IB77_9MICC|nr:FkbM family methyltransferase [Paenarthrobacter sp. MMS21-TAE1-1]MBU8868314.1 FkbM family methyltransferase [Paenarthrobacter sp. MMS21-TAE1-1]